MRANLHIHTKCSGDCLSDPPAIFHRAFASGLGCVAITDHNRLAGALEFEHLFGDRIKVIVGEEIQTTGGEILGFFLKQEIPKGRSPLETIQRIKDQGGLVGIPHPGDFRRSGMPQWLIEELLDRIDFIETFNARTFDKSLQARFQLLAEAWKKPQSAGSDAHTISELDNVALAIPDFQTPAEFLQSLQKGKLLVQVTAPRTVCIASTVAKWVKVPGKLLGRVP